MIEAYEIGIKLALQDGVSTGIAAIRGDLGSLDQAIAQTALRLGQLQRIGVQALAASQERAGEVMSNRPSSKSAPVIVAPSPPEPQPAVLPAETTPGNQTPVPSARVPAVAQATPSTIQVPVEGPVSSSAPVPSGLGATVPAVAARPSSPTVDIVRPAVAARLPEQSLVLPVTRATPATLRVATVTQAGQATPKLQSGETLPPANQRPQGRTYPLPPSSMLPPAPGIRALAQPQAPAEARDRERIRIVADESSGRTEPRTRLPVALLDRPAMHMAPTPAKPAALLPSSASAAPAPASSYAPPAASSRAKETAMRGDVFLDGARVGRWMSGQMARDAGRPNTGPTGFDPRRSAAWPGAAVSW